MENKFMQEAINQAKIAFACDEVPVGCVITFENKIIAKAHNQNRQLKDVFAHAEFLALREACDALDSARLDECDIYITLEPCLMCYSAISWARIKRLYFGALDEKFGAISGGNKFANYHKLEIYSGIAEKESVDLLQEFFRLKR